MDSIVTVSLFIVGLVITIIGYFLKNTYNDIKSGVEDLKDDFHSHTEEHGKLKGKLELLEQEHRLKYQLIQEVTQQEIKNMASQIGKLSDTVGELVTFQIKQNAK
jgi:uncharacterized protein YoxC